MCCCGKPTINGQPGYSWDCKTFSTRPVDPPALSEGDELLCDEPGRCGHGTDSHCHHFRIVKARFGPHYLLVRNGCGDKRISLGHGRYSLQAILAMDSDARYWLLEMIYHVLADEVDKARKSVESEWRLAAAEKRIKTQKIRNSNRRKVWIEERTEGAEVVDFTV